MRRSAGGWRAAIPVVLLLAPACRTPPPTREFTAVGQIVAVDRQTNHVTLRHDDIKGFMPAMTMPFAVKDPALLNGRAPGELVTATLQLRDTEAWISRLVVTGAAPLPPSPPATEAGLAPGDRVPDQAFIDQDDRPLTLAWLDGHAAVVTFVYTRCPLPDFCPAIDRRFVQVQEAILDAAGASGASGALGASAVSGASGAIGGVRLLSISIDPGFDRPEVLKAHARKLGANPAVWRFVTGPPAQIAAFGRRFGLDVRQAGPGPADIEHNLRTVVLDRQRRIVETRTGTGWTAADLLATLRKVAGA